MEEPPSLEQVQRPFRFIAAWVLHDKFNDLVRKEWRPDRGWDANIECFAQACRLWNREVFGNIQKRKNHLLHRLDGVSKELARKGSLVSLEELQQNLWTELEEVLTQEALLWAQKARVN